MPQPPQPWPTQGQKPHPQQHLPPAFEVALRGCSAPARLPERGLTPPAGRDPEASGGWSPSRKALPWVSHDQPTAVLAQGFSELPLGEKGGEAEASPSGGQRRCSQEGGAGRRGEV